MDQKQHTAKSHKQKISIEKTIPFNRKGKFNIKYKLTRTPRFQFEIHYKQNFELTRPLG